MDFRNAKTPRSDLFAQRFFLAPFDCLCACLASFGVFISWFLGFEIRGILRDEKELQVVDPEPNSNISLSLLFLYSLLSQLINISLHSK